MKDQTFDIYTESNVSLSGEIRDGCLYLTSEVWGEYDSEQHIEFSKEATEQLFSIITLKEFIFFCQKEHLIGLEKYLDEKGIERTTFTF